MADQTPYTTGGTVQAGGGVYLTRRADEELLGLCREGTFAFVLAARQTGKSSLMTHAVEQLLAEGIRSAVVDLNGLGAQLSAEEWYLGFLSEVESQLGLRTSAVAWWQEHANLGITQRLTNFLKEVLLEEIQERVVLFVDEIDTTLSLSFTDDFFASIRSLHNARAQHPALERLSFVLLGVATPGDLIKDAARTPFNLGRRVELTDFEFLEARPLAAGLGPDREVAERVLRWVLEWTSGHPYLTQRVCFELASAPAPATSREGVGAIVQRLFLGEKSFEDNNLQFVRDMLTKRAPDVAETLQVYEQVRRAARPVRDEEQSLAKSHLKLSGVLQREGELLAVRNSIYSSVFDLAWVRAHLPTWTRLLQSAVLQRAALLFASAGFLLLAPASYLLWKRASEAEVSRQQAEEVRLKAQRDADEVVRKATQLGASTEIALAQAKAESEKIRADLQRQLAKAESANTKLEQRAAELDQSRAELELQRAAADQRATEVVEAQKRNEDDQERQRAERLLALAGASADLQFATALTAEALKRHPSPGVVGQLAERVATMRQKLTGIGALFSYLDSGLQAATLSPDGKLVATPDGTGQVWIWNAASGEQRVHLTDCGPPNIFLTLVAFSPSGKFVATNSIRTVCVWEVATGKLRTLSHRGSVVALAFSPDGRTIATASDDKVATLWALGAGPARNARLRHGGGVNGIAFSPSGTWIATAGEDGFARLWNARPSYWDALDSKPEWLMPHPEPVQRVAFSADGDSLLTIAGTRVRLWDVKSRKLILTLDPELKSPVATISPNGRLIATAGDDSGASLWDASTGKLVRSWSSPDVPASLEFSPDSKMLATVPRYGWTASLWDVATGALLRRISHEGLVSAAVFTADGRELVTASHDGTAAVWDIAAKKFLGRFSSDDHLASVAFRGETSNGSETRDDELKANVWSNRPSKPPMWLRLWRISTSPSGPTSVAFNSDGQRLTIAAEGSNTEVWDVGLWRLILLLPQATGPVAFSPDGKRLLAASPESILVFDVSKGERTSSLPYNGRVRAVAYSPDGRSIAIAGEDKRLLLWSTATDKPPLTLSTEAVYRALSFNADGTKIAAASDDKIAGLWDASSGAHLADLRHDGPVRAVAFSPSGKMLVTASYDQKACFWSALTGEKLGELPHEGPVRAVSFSPDGRWVLTASDDGQAYLWDAESHVQTRVFKHGGPVIAAAFNADGQTIITASQDRMARIWEARTGTLLASFTRTDPVQSVAFSPNGKLAVIAGGGVALFTPWRAEDVLEAACSLLQRNLDRDEWTSALGPEVPYRPTCPNLP